MHLGVVESVFGLPWDAYVAVGTLALAIGTVALAASTRKVARASLQEVAAQTRPILLPIAAELSRTPMRDDWEGGPDPEAKAVGELRVTVRNIGNGPALAVSTFVDAPKLLGPSARTPIPPGEEAQLRAEVDATMDSFSLVFSYQDLAGLRHESKCVATSRMADEGLTTPQPTISNVEIRGPVG